MTWQRMFIGCKQRIFCCYGNEVCISPANSGEQAGPVGGLSCLSKSDNHSATISMSSNIEANVVRNESKRTRRIGYSPSIPISAQMSIIFMRSGSTSTYRARRHTQRQTWLVRGLIGLSESDNHSATISINSKVEAHREPVSIGFDGRQFGEKAEKHLSVDPSAQHMCILMYLQTLKQILPCWDGWMTSWMLKCCSSKQSAVLCPCFGWLWWLLLLLTARQVARTAIKWVRTAFEHTRTWPNRQHARIW